MVLCEKVHHLFLPLLKLSAEAQGRARRAPFPRERETQIKFLGEDLERDLGKILGAGIPARINIDLEGNPNAGLNAAKQPLLDQTLGADSATFVNGCVGWHQLVREDVLLGPEALQQQLENTQLLRSGQQAALALEGCGQLCQLLGDGLPSGVASAPAGPCQLQDRFQRQPWEHVAQSLLRKRPKLAQISFPRLWFAPLPAGSHKKSYRFKQTNWFAHSL